MTSRLQEVALTQQEIDKILSVCGLSSLLVGGQALALWAGYFNVQPVGELSKSITTDVDFIGTRQTADALRASLDWNIWLPTMDDATDQTAKITKLVPGGGVKQIDFLRSILGLDTRAVQSRAVELTLNTGHRVRILHPLDVMESRMRNLYSLPAKRNAAGIAQANLAISVAEKFIESLIESNNHRVLLDAVERMIQIALDKRLTGVVVDYELDPLAAIPWSRIAMPDFQTKRWPQVLRTYAANRQKYNQIAAKRAAKRTSKP